MPTSSACSFPARRSCVYLVGAGPGAPGLLTVKAMCLINRADVVVYDRLVSDEVMRMVPPGVSRIFVGKADGNHYLDQEEINQLLVRLARSRRRVVRLKGGDPFTFGRGGEEALYLARHQVDFEVVPGITAASACGAYAGIPLTHRDLAQAVIFVTGHGSSEHDLGRRIAEQYADNLDATLVVYMGLGQLPAIMSALIERGVPMCTPVALIEQGTTANQRRVLSTVAQAGAQARQHGLNPPTLVIIGKVVGLAPVIDWFEPGLRLQAMAGS